MSVALSDIQSRLHAGVSALQWVVNGYALTFASLMLTAGSLSDRFGRRKVMLVGLAIFACGSLLGALAPNSDVLIGARVIMGVGAAASEPGTLVGHPRYLPGPRGAARAARRLGRRIEPGPGLRPGDRAAPVGIGTWRAIFWFNVAASGWSWFWRP